MGYLLLSGWIVNGFLEHPIGEGVRLYPFLRTIQGKAGANGEKSDRRQSPTFPMQATVCQPVLKSSPRSDLIRNHQVGGSSPPAGSNEINGL